MSSEWLNPPSHKRNASRFERELKGLKEQYAFQGKGKTFLAIEWERVLDLDGIEEIIDWADSEEERELESLARALGDVADKMSAQMTIFEVSLTASGRELIADVVPLITDKVRSYGGNPGPHSLEYEELEDENIPGYWFSKGLHIFE